MHTVCRKADISRADESGVPRGTIRRPPSPLEIAPAIVAVIAGADAAAVSRRRIVGRSRTRTPLDPVCDDDGDKDYECDWPGTAYSVNGVIRTFRYATGPWSPWNIRPPCGASLPVTPAGVGPFISTFS